MASYDRSDQRYAKRRTATRLRISEAADTLFTENGYEGTSLEGIAAAADVAVRTIYLHFDSKAAILLDFFDRWLIAFTDAVIARPVEEPVSESVTAALDALAAAGWSNREIADMTSIHPVVAFLGSGPQEIAGHLLQSWIAAMERIATDARERRIPGGESLAAEARASAVMATWFGSMLVFRAPSTAGPARSAHEVGQLIARAFERGSAADSGDPV